MLNIRVVYRARRTVEYYLRKAEGRSAGIWLGSGCPLIGVRSGQAVERRDFSLALDGYGVGGDPLVHVIAKNRRCAYDVVLSLTKSVSLAAVAGDPRVKGTILSVIERLARRFVGWLQSLVRSRGEVERGAPLAVACFTHEFSRVGDEHMHLHFIVLNFTGGKTRSVRAIEAKGFFKNHLPLERRFQQELAKMLRRKGINAELDSNGRAFVPVSKSLCEASSRMRLRINRIAEGFGDVTGKRMYRLREVIADRLARTSGSMPKPARIEIGWEDVIDARGAIRPFSFVAKRALALVPVPRQLRWAVALERLREDPRFPLSAIWTQRTPFSVARRRTAWARRWNAAANAVGGGTRVVAKKHRRLNRVKKLKNRKPDAKRVGKRHKTDI